MPDAGDSDHLLGCSHVHAPDWYAEILSTCDEERQPGWTAHVKRVMDESQGVYLLRCAPGCPHLERLKRRGVELAHKHGWLKEWEDSDASR